MFQPFCLIVNLVPRVVEEIMEETLQQAVMAKNLQSAHLPTRCQTHAAVLFVFYKRRLLRRELLEHTGDGCGTNAEMQRVDAAVVSAVPMPWGTETILLSEDEEGVRRFVLESLERRGYRVLACCNGREAIERARQHPGAIDLLITDAVMPEMGGAELAAQFADCHPGVPVLCMSGYSAMVWPGADAAGPSFLQKPFTPAALLMRVRALLDRGEASRAAA